MPFDTFTLELAFFLSLLTILASLPTDPYFYPWNDASSSYRISYDPYAPPLLSRNDPVIQSQIFAVRNFTEARGDPGFPPEVQWFHIHERGRGFQEGSQNFPEFPDSNFGSVRSPSLRRSSGPIAGNERTRVGDLGNDNLDVKNNRNSFSSHVNCEEQNQKSDSRPRTEKSKTNLLDIIVGSEVGKRLQTDQSSKDQRVDEEAVPNGRIVTPKVGRRPTQGSSGKNQGRPFMPGGTNTISTTEKTFRNQTVKVSKRPRPRPQGSEIVFPDGISKKFIPRVTKCGKKSTFCVQVGDDYPSDHISQVLKKEGAMFRELFGEDVINDPVIEERINGANAPEENSLCLSKKDIVYPKAAQNKEDKWLFIINQDQYVQGVAVEVCVHPESSCLLTEGFPLGYTTYCKQKYIERKLVAIGEDGMPHSDSFRLPSCCTCVVKHDISARLASPRYSRQVSQPSL